MSAAVRRAEPMPRRWVLNDSLGFEYTLVADCDDPFSFSATLWDPLARQAGLLAWHRVPGNQIQLDELRIEPEVAPASFKAELRWVLAGNQRIIAYRGRGLGRLLLQIAIAASQDNCAARLYGFLSQDDLRENPDLVKWLWHLGFTIADPPPNAPRGTAHCAYLDLA